MNYDRLWIGLVIGPFLYSIFASAIESISGSKKKAPPAQMPVVPKADFDRLMADFKTVHFNWSQCSAFWVKEMEYNKTLETLSKLLREQVERLEKRLAEANKKIGGLRESQ